jgi:hypothetical protein
MLSPAQARELLGPKGEGLSDEELVRLLAELYELAAVVVDTARRAQRKQGH